MNLKLQKGVTLLEVMIALVVFSIGLLGLAALQANTLKQNHSAWMRTTASNLSYDIVDRMRANRDVSLSTNNYIVSYSECVEQAGTSIAAVDITQWCNLLNTSLPSGEGSIARVATTNVFVISVRWLDDRDDDDSKLEFVVQVEI